MSVFNLKSLKNALTNKHEKNTELESFDIQGVAKLIANGNIKNIVTMVGAGISTAAGIPDFRSPATGLYDNLSEYGLDDPMDVFTLSFFQKNPKPFFEVARRLYKPNALPTLGHYFIRLLNEKGLLRRHYTQNVDNLERLSGLELNKLIEAHGSFNTGHCRTCNKEYDFNFLKESILKGGVPNCTVQSCNGVVKPDIVFFGEGLPSKFNQSIGPDFSNCDLLIIMGTSLTVLPFCGLIHRVGSSVPRLYINLSYGSGDTGSGLMSFLMRFYVAGLKESNMLWGKPNNKRDVFHKATIDDGVLELAELLGWKDELLQLQRRHNAALKEGTFDANKAGLPEAPLPRASSSCQSSTLSATTTLTMPILATSTTVTGDDNTTRISSLATTTLATTVTSTETTDSTSNKTTPSATVTSVSLNEKSSE